MQTFNLSAVPSRGTSTGAGAGSLMVMRAQAVPAGTAVAACGGRGFTRRCTCQQQRPVLLRRHRRLLLLLGQLLLRHRRLRGRHTVTRVVAATVAAVAPAPLPPRLVLSSAAEPPRGGATCTCALCTWCGGDTGSDGPCTAPIKPPKGALYGTTAAAALAASTAATASSAHAQPPHGHPACRPPSHRSPPRHGTAATQHCWQPAPRRAPSSPC